jgi:biopolymer transport protein ExbD
LRSAHGLETPDKYLFEHERHRSLISALGLPEYSAGFGYRYLAESISRGHPLSRNFNSTGVPYQEPKFEISSAPPVTEDDADIVVEIKSESGFWRRRGADDAVPVEPDLGAQLRNAEDVSVSSVVLLRLAADLNYQRVGQLLASLHRAGFSRVIFGTAPKL